MQVANGVLRSGCPALHGDVAAAQPRWHKYSSKHALFSLQRQEAVGNGLATLPRCIWIRGGKAALPKKREAESGGQVFQLLDLAHLLLLSTQLNS